MISAGSERLLMLMVGSWEGGDPWSNHDFRNRTVHSHNLALVVKVQRKHLQNFTKKFISAHLTKQQSMRNDIERFDQVTKRQCQRVTDFDFITEHWQFIHDKCVYCYLVCNKCCWWKITNKLKIISLCCLILNTYMNISYLKSFFNKIELSPCIFLNLCSSFKRGWNITGNITTDTAIRRACKNIFTFTAIINY